MNKFILAILLLLPVAANAQRISALGTTNVAAGTNVIALVVAPNVTNGTRQIRVDNLFSNRTLSGFVTLTNLNGYTVAGTAITNIGGTTTNVFTVPIPDDNGALLKFFGGWKNENANVSGGHEAVASFYNEAGVLSASGGTTNQYILTSGGYSSLAFTVSGTNILVRLTALSDTLKWRARLEVLHSPP